MTILNSILAFIVAIGLLVTVHEFGHFLAARLAGVKVLRFSIGFGPALLRWGGRDGGTEYVLAALPLGGYVKMLDEREGEVAEADRVRAYNVQPVSRRLAIVLAGPLFNFVFAILAYWAVYMAGVPGIQPVVGSVEPSSVAAEAGFEELDRIVAVNGKATPTWNIATIALLEGLLEDDRIQVTVKRDSGGEETLHVHVDSRRPLTEPGALLPGLGLIEWLPDMVPEIGEVMPGSAAEAGGLQRGDRILQSGGRPVEGIASWIEDIQASPGKTLPLSVLRDGEVVQLHITPESVRGDDDRLTGRIGAQVGVSRDIAERLFALEQYGAGEALWRGIVQTGDISLLTLRVLGRMVTGDVSLKNLSGPINIADYAGRSASYGLVSFLVFLAIVSISLGVLNLLPLPILDGGHALFLVWESLRGAPIPVEAEAIGQRVGIVFLAMLMSVAFYNDIVRLL